MSDDQPTLFPIEEPRLETCAACRKGDHIDHHHGVWRKADGTDPVRCPCPCDPANPEHTDDQS